MNKAFTKESDNDEFTEAVVRPVDPLPPNAPNYVTLEGARGVREELRRLIDEEKPALEVQASARQGGDGALANESKTKARKKLAEVTARIQLLESHIGRFQIVDGRQQRADTVRFGARVTVIDTEGDERTYLICGVDESEPGTGAVSWISPIAKVLLGHKIGDEVTLQLPRGKQLLEIVEIDY